MELKTFLPKLMAAFCNKYSITNATFPKGFNVATITDTVFLMIQNDRELMFEYLQTIVHHGNLGHANSEIAKEIKRYFGLSNAGLNKYPNSFLIQSFENFC
ncbi:MAG: hypothetical protein LBH22_01760 [Bacteroidales bacterium]|jgi:hypothetical protein|nr:hypothetical protein [Bacteroidales bacterium]